jgi:AhpD family alkylhydroperoxidase
MARLPYPDPSDAPERVRDALTAVPPLNIFRMLSHAQTAFRPFLRFGAAILSELELDPALREFAILVVAHDTDAEYEWVQHVAIARAVGVSEEQSGCACSGPTDCPQTPDPPTPQVAGHTSGTPLTSRFRRSYRSLSEALELLRRPPPSGPMDATRRHVGAESQVPVLPMPAPRGRPPISS